MPLFVLLGIDGPAGLARRPAARPGHLAHWAPLDGAGRIRFGGPLLDAAGQPCGSTLIFEALDLEAARAQAETDPYVTDGIFARVEIYETKAVFPAS